MDTTRCPGCMKEISQPLCPHCGWSAYDQNAPHQLPVGTILNDKYIIGKVLGQGGFGITYLGWDKYLEQPVAIKEYYPSGSVMRESVISTMVASYGGALAARYQRNKERFLQEAQILARFNEEKEIVHVSSMFEANNTAYFVMEFVDGITLKQHVKNRGGKLSVKETFALLKPVMNALEKVHKAGIVHRDISPDNIMLLPEGGVKLIDFGAVRNVANADQETPLTKSTEAILKQGYAPIEQYQNRGSLGPWTDVYALCATILFCLTGEVPPDAPERLLTEAPLEIQKRIPSLSTHQAAVLEQGMAMHPRDRIPSMRELHKQLFSPVARITPPPAPVKSSDPAPQPKKRKWWIPLAAVLAVVAIALAVIFTQPAEADPIPTDTPTVPPTSASTEAPTVPLTGIPAEDNVLMADTFTGELRAMKRENGVHPLKYNRDIEMDMVSSQDAFGTDIPRSSVITLTFCDSLADAPEDTWDVSRNQNGCVLAWAKKSGSYYELYIGADGGVYAPEDSSFLLAFYPHLEHIHFNGAFHTENATDMYGMFMGLNALESLEFTGFNTSRVTNLGLFLTGCQSLAFLDVSALDTSNVTNMEKAFALGEQCYATANYFYNQSALKELDLSTFDTRNVVTMDHMFAYCNSLIKLDLQSFDTSNVMNMSGLFYFCRGLEEINLSGFNTANVADMSCMFLGCHSVLALDLNHFDTSNVTDMSGMFYQCNQLQTLDLRNFNTSKVTDMCDMFRMSDSSEGGSNQLTSLNISSFDTSSVMYMDRMFIGCENLTRLDLSHFDTSNVESMVYMFGYCMNLKYLNLYSFDTRNVKYMDWMFHCCWADPIINRETFVLPENCEWDLDELYTKY